MYLCEVSDETSAIVEYAVGKANYRLVDTAEFYQNEFNVGEGIRRSGVDRSKVFVTTKLCHTGGGQEGAIKTVENSLRQLNIGYIDQFLLHAPHGGKVLECYDVLLDYQSRGLIKSVGVSNFGVEHLEAMKNSGRPLPQVNQIELHPWCTNEDIVEWCQKNGVVLTGYSPLARNPDKLKDPLVVALAKKYNKTPAQVLIRWSLQRGYVTIPKSSKQHRVTENSNVFDFKLDDEEVNQLSEYGKHVKESSGWDPTKNDMDTEFGPRK
jgi:methylglyoxal/glyoxal reductase